MITAPALRNFHFLLSELTFTAPMSRRIWRAKKIWNKTDHFMAFLLLGSNECIVHSIQKRGKCHVFFIFGNISWQHWVINETVYPAKYKKWNKETKRGRECNDACMCTGFTRKKKRVGGLSVAVFCYLRSCQTTFMNCLHFYIALEMYVCACVCMYNMREAKVKHIDPPKQRQQLQKSCINSLSRRYNLV